MFYKKIPTKLIIILILLISSSAYLIKFQVDKTTPQNLPYDQAKTQGYLKTVSWSRYLNHTQTLRNNYDLTVKYFEDTQYAGLVNLNLINEKEKELSGISRQLVLKKLFDEVYQKHFNKDAALQELVENIQLVLYHTAEIQPLYPDQTIVADPLVLLEIGIGKCGHSARLAVDILNAAGYDARYIQAANHITAEVFWKEKWRLLPVDLAMGADVIKTFGFWPSFQNLINNPELVDRYPPQNWPFLLRYSEDWRKKMSYLMNDQEYSSNAPGNTYYYFGDTSDETQLGYWTKATDKSTWQNDRYYGWASLNRSTYPRVHLKLDYSPEIPTASTNINGNLVQITLSKPSDKDDDFYRFEFYLSDHSRGWDYNNKNVNLEKASSKIDHNKGIYFSTNQSVELNLDKGKYYLTIFAKDKKAIKDPNVFFAPSEEYAFEIT